MQLFLTLSLLSIALGYGIYMPPGPGDQRPPCPLINALANHGEIPRDGWFTREGLIHAIERTANMCSDLSDIFFQFGFTLPTAITPLFPFNESWILNIRALETFNGGQHDASVSRVDFKNGNSTNYNETYFNNTFLRWSTDGETMTLDDIYAGHNYAGDLSNASAFDRFRGSGDMALLWNAFGRQPIPITDLLTLFRGRLPDSWANRGTTATWCTREILEVILTEQYGPLPFSDTQLYTACKTFAGPADSTICENAFPSVVEPVTPLNWVGVSYTAVQPLGDPFDALWEVALKFPSKNVDENCALNATQLLQARLLTLAEYYAALQAPTFEQVVALASPIFVNSDETSIHQAAAGDYYGVDDIIEYITLVIPSLNGGYVWFSPSVLDPTSVKYFPQNATVFAKQTHNTTFDCYEYPNILNPDGLCNSPVVKGIAGGMFTFTNCGTQITQYISNFDAYTNEAAVRSSNNWDNCWRIMRHCTGNNTQYGGVWENCMRYMQLIPTTSCKNSVLRGNTTVCRGLHAFLTEYRPNIHCPHTGPDSKTCHDADCDEVVCPGDFPPGDYRSSVVPPISCTSDSSVLAGSFLMVVLSLVSCFF